ncbi:16S rRNA (guanine(966)-N(2))-methyltransferase RsmD [Alteromonas sp. H39]|uniref:16S rRNA (guanine(966)-N(2))-methyltransferase RsmD n=1 Tax=Alteromonas sp. H39 TaxID=3389876 RepID=UPI0039E1144D
MIALSASMKRVSQSSRKQPSKTGQIRVIAGQWRGRKLPVSDVEGLRPTTDRNKETLFNWLMQDIRDARCLDVFAGSGGLGIEALSRYAKHCVFFEKDKQAASILRKNLQTLGANAEVRQGDALSLLNDQHQPFDIIFVDPPFGMNLVNPTLASLSQNRLLASGTLIYVEQESQASDIMLPPDSRIIKEKRLPQLHYLLIELD